MPVPWAQILQWVPPILELSRDLLQRAKRPPAGAQAAALRSTAGVAGDAATPALGALQQRVAALEDNEQRQAQLVADMASQVAKLSEAVVVLHRQARLMSLVTGALLLVTLLSLGTVIVMLLRQ
jgi:hypothetical protein